MAAFSAAFFFNMKILGIAAEYNPFHNGHEFHIEESKKITGADHVIAVMSGDFVQRGEPAVSDKWSRAELAVRNGADLVLELPFVFACNGASQFAKGAAGILDSLGCVSFMSFGSELGDMERLKAFAAETVDFDRESGYAKNMGDAMAEAGLSSDANNILALEYLRELERLSSDIIPVTVKRCDRGYSSDEIDGGFASASKLRSMLLNGEVTGDLVPEMPERIFSFSDEIKDRLFRMVTSEVLRRTPDELDRVPSAGEGIGYRLHNEIRKAQSYDQLVDIIRAGRYSKARIKRVLIQILLGAYDVDLIPSYARVLAFNEKGASILKHIRKNELLKDDFLIINNINKEDVSSVQEILQFDILASDMYNLLMSENLYEGSDMVCMPHMQKK